MIKFKKLRILAMLMLLCVPVACASEKNMSNHSTSSAISVVLPTTFDGVWKDDVLSPIFEVSFDSQNGVANIKYNDYETVLSIASVDHNNDYTLKNEDGDYLVVKMSDNNINVITDYSYINGSKLSSKYQELTREVKATSFELYVDELEHNDDGYYHLIANDECVVTTFNIYPSDANVKDVSWTIDDPELGEYNTKTNIFKALDSGKVTLIASMNHNPDIKATVTFIVDKEVGPTSLTINASKTTIEVDEMLQLSVDYSDGTNREGVTWATNSSAIADVSPDGIVTGYSGGEATITATSVFDPSVKTSITIKVNKSKSLLPDNMLGTWVFSDDSLDYDYGVKIVVHEDGNLEVYLVIDDFDMYIDDYTLDPSSGRGTYFYSDHYNDCSFMITFNGTTITSVSYDDSGCWGWFGETVYFATIEKL